MFGLSAIECFILIIAVYTVLYWIIPRKGAAFPMFAVVVLLAVLAYNVVPNVTDDLMRYYMQIDYMRDLGYDYLKNCIETGFYDWDTYRVCAYYFYFISKLPSNNWLPTITIFIVYGLMMLIIYKAANRFEVNKTYLYLATLFFLSTYWYYDTYAGIRNGLAFAIIFACAYYHLVERKRIVFCIAGYVTACLLHSASIMLVALVVIAVITLNTNGKFIKYFLILGLVGGGVLIQYLSTVTDNKFIQTIAGRAESSQATETLSLQTNYVVNMIMYVVVAAILIYASYYIVNGEYADTLKRFYKYNCIIMYFVLGCLYSGLIFVRFVRWVLPVIGAIIYMIGAQIQSNQIQQEGEDYFKYYAPVNVASRVKLRSFFTMLYVGFTAVHFWYLYSGSSLSWMHF